MYVLGSTDLNVTALWSADVRLGFPVVDLSSASWRVLFSTCCALVKIAMARRHRILARNSGRGFALIFSAEAGGTCR